ncbi:unnamed protein product, partial [Rotaria magnacalcarata]
IIAFYNGSIIADFVLGFTSPQDVTRLNSFLNRTLVNEALFGGTILSIDFHPTAFNTNNNNNNNIFNYRNNKT